MLLALACPDCFCQVSGSVGANAPAMGFAVIAPDPVYSAKAYSGLAADNGAAWAARMNQAAAAFSPARISAALSYLGWKADGSTRLSAAGSFRMDSGIALSAALSHGGSKAYTEYDGLGNKLDEFSPEEIHASLGAAYKFGNYSAGASVHYLQGTYSTGNGISAICADITGYARFDSFNVSAGLKNIGGKVKDDSGDGFSLPSFIFAAGEYRCSIGDGSEIKADLDLGCFLSAGFSAAAGIEYSFKGMVFARGGYHLGNDVLPGFASIGAGFRFAGIALDAAYLLSSSPMGGSFQVGLSAGF